MRKLRRAILCTLLCLAQADAAFAQPKGGKADKSRVEAPPADVETAEQLYAKLDYDRANEVAERVSATTGNPMVRVAAAAMETEQYTEGHIFLGATVGPGEMTRTTARKAYEQWGYGPKDLSMVQVHDAFPIEELLYYELLDICADGEGDALVHDGATALGGRIPFSTDGGLIARGHPGGPTGLAQVHETVLQLRGQAGSRQVENARAGLVQMMGGGSVCVIHILERA